MAARLSRLVTAVGASRHSRLLRAGAAAGTAAVVWHASSSSAADSSSSFAVKAQADDSPKPGLEILVRPPHLTQKKKVVRARKN